MENIEEIFHEYIRIKLSTSKEAYINELINNKNYLSLSDDEGYMHVQFEILNKKDMILAFMAGYDIFFYDYEDVVSSTDGEDGNIFNLVSNAGSYIFKSDAPQNIYLNLFINRDMPLEVEGYLYIHLRDMLFQMLHYVPDYIAGYIRKDCYEMIEEELDEQGYMVINEDIECLEILRREIACVNSKIKITKKVGIIITSFGNEKLS